MSLTCPMCREEWIFTTKLCTDCDRISKLMRIYDRRIVLDILDKCLTIQKFKDNNDYVKNEAGKWIKKGEEDIVD